MAAYGMSNNQLKRHDPVILGCNDKGPIIKRFDYDQGIVVGAVPGGTSGQEVSILGNASQSVMAIDSNTSAPLTTSSA